MRLIKTIAACCKHVRHSARVGPNLTTATARHGPFGGANFDVTPVARARAQASERAREGGLEAVAKKECAFTCSLRCTAKGRAEGRSEGGGGGKKAGGATLREGSHCSTVHIEGLCHCPTTISTPRSHVLDNNSPFQACKRDIRRSLSWHIRLADSTLEEHTRASFKMHGLPESEYLATFPQSSDAPAGALAERKPENR